MAEFKLGRIKFVWQGEWQLGQSYVVDDVVTISGKSYICVINHIAGVTNNTFAGDLNIVGAPKWELLSDGIDWTGDWQASHYYDEGALVKYGGRVYVCKTAHTSATNVSPTWLGLEADQSKWDVFAESINWRNGWEPATKYSINDFVSNDGYTYICNTAHISAADIDLGLEDDLEKWDVVNQGFIYHGDWVGEVRYHVNDIVKYGASVWICTTKHLATTTFDDAKWALFVEGLEFESSWDNATGYQIGDVVTYGGYSYIAKTNNTGSNPSTGLTATTDWSVYTTGFNFRGDYVNTTAYLVGDVIRLNGYTYLCVDDTTGNAPPDTDFWNRINSGLYWTNPEGTYTAVPGVTLTGSGTDATFNVVRTNTKYTVTVENGGSSYVNGDTIKILGTSLGGLSPANDLTLTVTSENLNAIVTVSVNGYSSTWTSGHVYVLGDVTFWGANSYICVAGHIAETANRPDNDSVAAYWNLLAAGAEESVLTMQGDTVYYSETGPTRLPIGTDGQILRVRNGYPEWSYYGVVNNVVYVAPSGTNSEESGWGLTVDKPWSSVRYACDQVRAGYLNRNATKLLKKNKQFLMKEVTAWINYTYSVAVEAAVSATNAFTVLSTANLSVGMPIQFSGTTGGVTAGTKYFVKEIIDATHFTIATTQGGTSAVVLSDSSVAMTGTLSYDSAYCERDTGLLVEALIYDLGHGGTDEITKCAKAYYTSAGAEYINANFGQQTAQTIAAYNYLKEIVVNVLGNVPPKRGYQVANEVYTGATQHIDTSLVAEEGTGTVATTLLTIVTDGIEAGEVTSIPAGVYSNTTINVKTGTYYEILPIIIPKNTAVVGDELRGTTVSPNRAIANLVNDKPKTISALNRIKAVAANIIANNTVVPTEGNTAVQQYIYNNHESIVSSSVRSNVSIMADIITNGSTSAPSLTLTDPTDYDAGYSNARALIIGNTAFLKAEVSAYMNDNYSSVWSALSNDQKDKCTRDIGYIVDALAYDLTYGGNLETVAAARSYYSLGEFVEPSNQKTAAIAVQGRLKAIISDIAQKITITKSTSNAATQYTTGTAGSAGAGTFAQDRIQEMIDTITTGTAPTVIEPTTSWVSPAKLAAHTTLQNAKATIQAQAIAWIDANYPTLDYNKTLCSRDVGYILDALCYDMVFGVNFRSVKAALSYYRNLASTNIVTTTQNEESAGVVLYIGLLAEMHTAGTSTLNTNINTMSSVIAGGTAPSYVWPNPLTYDSGYYHARRLLIANTQFLKDEVTAYMVANYSSVWTGLGAGGQAKCTRDVGYIVDALTFDLTYGGNLGTVIAARSYYSNGTFVEPSGEKTAALAVQTRIKDIIDNIVQGLTTGWTKSAGNTSTQYTTGTAGSAGAATFAQARIQEMYDTINTGTEPTTIEPSTSWVATELTTANTDILAVKAHLQTAATDWVNETYPDLYYNKATCERDVGYIIDALRYDMMFGSNFLSIQSANSYYRNLASTLVVTSSQLHPTLAIVGFIGAAVKEVASGATHTVGRIKAADRIVDSADTMYAIVQDGISLAPTEYMPQPSNINSNYAGAVNQITNNYAFLKAEVSAYINANYTSLWTSLGVSGQASCQRDVGYILDGLRYDLTYGGNTQTLIVGSSYYSYIDLVIASGEVTATVAAYTHLKSIIDNIVKGEASGTTWTKQAGNALSQTTTGSKDTVGGAATFAQARIQDIIDWINNGVAPATIEPNTDWVDPALVAGFTALQAKKAEIKLHGLGHVNKTHQDLAFNEATCSRDIGYMVDAMGYDMMFGSNFASIIVGKSYYRALSSTAVVLASQKQASLDLIEFLKYKAKGIATAGAVAQMATTINDIIDAIKGGAVPAFSWPDPSNISANYQAARTLISDNKDFIKEEVISYISENYPDLSYDPTVCARDVGYIIDALHYDLTYGGNLATRMAANAYYSGLTSALQIASSEKTATLDVYAYMKTLVVAIAQNNAVASPLQTNVAQVRGTGGTSTEANAAGALVQVIIDTVDNISNLPAASNPSTGWVDSDIVAKQTALQSAKTTIQADVISYIGENYPNLNYNSTTCSRDVGYIVDAVGWDMVFNSNFQSVKSGMSYYRATAELVLAGQKFPTLDAMRYLKGLIADRITENDTALARAKSAMDNIIAILDAGIGSTPETAGTTVYNNSLGIAHAAELLRANQSFLENESTAWITYHFGAYTSGTSAVDNSVTTATNHNLSVGDPIQFTKASIEAVITGASSTGNIVTVKTTAGMYPGQKFSTVIGDPIGNITSGTYYFILEVLNTSQVVLSMNYNGSPFNPGNGSGIMTATVGGTVGTITTDAEYYVLTVPTPTTFTFGVAPDSTEPVSLSTDTGAIHVQYYFNEVLCKRDMGAYIQALIEDLGWTGNHASLYAAKLYNNAVAGSELSDMYWVSNASGLRNQTMTGLNGQLTDENSFGTKRPTAGAFVALNPGFGPYDSSVWVTTRSHYSQNCTMFGTGCTGAKIDSALHAGGNKSMVKNDFTTIISDGIGVWVTGSNALTELVSVFNYYGYAGYLAEKGGRIRATNGNSSYGTYGVIAEGVDSKETPLYGTVNNRAYDAQVSIAVTDGVAEVQRLEYSNAGEGYTNSIFTVSGTGYNVDAVGDEFRDSAVFETRIIDIDNNEGYGGSSYASIANAAQDGTAYDITIAATDTALSNAYNGMRIQLTGGTGAGQYANILTYGGGSKIAQVFKDSFAQLTVTAVSTTNNLLTVASTATITPGMAIYLTTAGNGLTANTLYYVMTANFSATQFSVSLTGAGGAAETITGNATGLTYGLVAAGWNHAIPGTTIKANLDLTTTYIIEPRISYTAPGYTATARTMNATTTWNKLLYGDNKFVAIPTTGTTTGYSTNGTTWATAGALSSSASWVEAVYGGGEGAVATAIVGGLGGRGAVLQAVFGVPNTTGAATETQIASVTVVDGGQGYNTPPVITFTGGGGTGAKATAVVLNGKIVRVDVTVPGSGYTSLPTVTAATDKVTKIVVNTWGRNYTSAPTVTIGAPYSATAWSSGGSGTSGTYYSYNYNIYRATSSGTFSSSAPVHVTGTTANGSVDLLYVGSQAVATASTTITGVGTIDGVYEIVLTDINGVAETSTSTYLGYAGSGYTTTPTVTIVDSNAKYVAVASNGVNCYTTGTGITAGTTWTAGTTMGGTPTIASLAYGSATGTFVAVGGTNSAYSSTNGSTWTSRTIPTLGAGTYSALAYGNKTFVAIGTGTVETAVSTNGTSWSTGGNMPGTATTWVSVCYGNGRFVALASGGRRVAYSLNRGTTWAEASPGLPSTQTWTHISYGQGLFFAVSSSSSVSATSPDGINWTVRAMPSSSNWNDIQFGNPNGTPIWTAVSSTSGTVGASIVTGAQALGRVKVASGVVTEVRMVEPGSGYPKGTVTATTTSTNLITVDNTTNLTNLQPIEFFGTDAGGLTEQVTYYVVTGTITSTQFKVATSVANAAAGTAVTLSTTAPSGMTYRAGPTITVTDPNNVRDVSLRARLGDGVLGNPSFYNRGADYATASAEVLGDGHSDLYQASTFVNVSGLSEAPQAGANVEFASLPGLYFKLVTVTQVLPDGFGNYTATFQVNPGISVLQAPKHGDLITTRLKYSQVRLTGHDFLYVGTGGYTTTNFPGTPLQAPDTAKQELYSAGGRVFFTSTDQDGNFNVGNLFGVQQATGTATLNASAFNLSGLNSLQLGSVELGIGSAIITQFSTDPYFTANSDSIVPTQRAIKAYITSQIGGGQSSLNVNTLTSGVVYVAGNSISTTTGVGLNVTSRMNFTGGIDGAPVALGFFMQR